MNSLKIYKEISGDIVIANMTSVSEAYRDHIFETIQSGRNVTQDNLPDIRNAFLIDMANETLSGETYVELLKLFWKIHKKIEREFLPETSWLNVSSWLGYPRTTTVVGSNNDVLTTLSILAIGTSLFIYLSKSG